MSVLCYVPVHCACAVVAVVVQLPLLLLLDAANVPVMVAALLRIVSRIASDGARSPGVRPC